MPYQVPRIAKGPVRVNKFPVRVNKFPKKPAAARCSHVTTRTYCVCSYGGCGSKMLSAFLKPYGKVVHMHDRYPPPRLTQIRQRPDGDGHFTKRPLCGRCLQKVFVIFLFRDPTEVQVSRWSMAHFRHIQVPTLRKHASALASPTAYCQKNQDLLQYGSFYNNYMDPGKKRNYKIFGVNYHKLFEPQNIRALCDALRLPSHAAASFPTKKETSASKFPEQRETLDRLNASLKTVIREAPFLQIVG